MTLSCMALLGLKITILLPIVVLPEQFKILGDDNFCLYTMCFLRYLMVYDLLINKK